MKIEQQFTVPAPPERVWAFLLDVPAMAACIPGASNVEAVDDSTYNATVTAKIGPISASFGCRVAIVEMDESLWTGAVELTGRDNKLGGSVKARMTMKLVEAEPGTRVEIVSDVDILGKIGQYGHGMVTKRANAMLEAFADCARARLAE